MVKIGFTTGFTVGRLGKSKWMKVEDKIKLNGKWFKLPMLWR